MTNPDNIVRVRARNGGRASVYEANAWCQPFSTGLVEGNGVVQNTSADMNVLVGGSTTKPDVLIAENASGYKIALDIVGQQAIPITAPASNSRISAIVAYTDDLSLPTTEDAVTGSPASCGLIVVNGAASASPSAPTDAQIRNAITADGATGSQATYSVMATIEVANTTTAITDSLITTNCAGIVSRNVDFSTFFGTKGMPIKETIIHAGIAGNLKVIRIGNICIANGSNVIQSWPTGNRIFTNAYVPAGFTPVAEAEILCLFLDGLTNNVPASFALQPDGKIMRSKVGDVTSSSRYDYNGIWITNDDWPEGD